MSKILLKRIAAAPHGLIRLETLDGGKTDYNATESEKVFAAIRDSVGVDRPSTLKALFDYFNQDKSFYWAMFLLNFIVAGWIGFYFLLDGFTELHCNRKLEAESALTAEANISKISKNRRGNIVWKMEFPTLSGEKIAGTRVAVNPEAATHAPGRVDSVATVIYSPEDLHCWDVSLEAGVRKLPRAQRWFSTEFTLGFGGFFAIFWAVVSVLFFRRAIQQRPLVKELEAFYQTL